MASKSNQSSALRRFIDWLTSFFSVEGKMRANAHNWLELADRVYHYRRDQLAARDLADLQQKRESLRTLVRERVDASRLKLGIEELEGAMRRTGGKIYPKSTVQEYVEFFLVAAIVVLGVRTYFVQPFKIPTNSMWPSYNGMTPKVYQARAEEPSYLGQAFRLGAYLAKTYRIDAPTDGEIMIQVTASSSRVVVPYREVQGKTWFVLPTTLKEYTLLVGDQPVTVRVPADFDFEWTLRDAFFPGTEPSREPSGVDLARVYAAQREKINDGRFQLLRTGKRVSKGDRVLSFDIMTGDQLFVDRISYHFIRPVSGSAFVFRTDHIHSEHMLDRSGRQVESYYIKRLVGVPGDKIEIRDPVLYRNGKPITGADAFEKNGRREDRFGGYRNIGLLESGSVVEVPADGFLALGDNSANSADGRYWGFVPLKEVVGRPLFIYYPFTRHWGTAP